MSYWNWNWDRLFLKHLFVSISSNPCCRLRHLLSAHVNGYKGRVGSPRLCMCIENLLMCVCAHTHACLIACACGCTRTTHALACIHVCIEGITYTAKLMWKPCSEPGFYILFIISWHNVGNRHQCSFLAQACKHWSGWVTWGEVLEF